MPEMLITEAVAHEIERVFGLQKAHARQIAQTTAAERIAKLKQLKDKIFEYEPAIQTAIYADYRRHEVEATLGEVYATIGDLNHTLKHIKKWMRPQAIDTPLSYVGTSGHILYEPKGVTLIMAPWNYPFSLLIRPLISAMAAGNTAVLKPSEMTPHISTLIKKMIGELFDENEVAVVEGDAQVANMLLEQPFNHICFTGSPAVGKIVMAAAAKHLASVTLELGGKSPHVVDETADIKKAAAQIAWGKCLNNGQTCIAPDYLLVQNSVKEPLLSEIRLNIEKMYNADGQGVQASPYFCRIVNQRHFNRLRSYIDDAVRQGADVAYGGQTDANENYVSPTILTGVHDGMKVMQDEIFGPILPIKAFDDLQEAADYINAKEKPLAMYIHSKREANIEMLLRQTSAGATVINDSMIHNTHPTMPFGGVNNSGIGKMNGWYGFQEFSNARGVLRQRFGSFSMIYPPYTDKVKKIVRFLTKYM
jgi:aldehyde dehydrogenase (NAD+)